MRPCSQSAAFLLQTCLVAGTIGDALTETANVHVTARANAGGFGRVQVNVHPHPHPPGSLGAATAPDLAHKVQRPLPAGADFAGENNSSWIPLPEFYKPSRTSSEAAHTLEEIGTELYWREWKQHLLDILAGDPGLAKEERRSATTGEMCKTAKDCEGRCRKRCLLEQAHLHCLEGPCSGTCRKLNDSCDHRGRYCAFACSDNCLEGCVRDHLYKLKNKRLNGCMPARMKQCSATCSSTRRKRPDRPKDFLSCHVQCVTKALDECVVPFARPCTSSCGRHICVRGRCSCPGLLSGDDECTEVPLALAAELPAVSQECFQAFQDLRFRETDDTKDRDLGSIDRGSEGETSPGLQLVALLGEHTRSTMETLSQYLWWSSRRRGRGVNAAKGTAGAAFSSLKPDLKDMADWTSCAIIGSSGSLTAAGLGPTIDSAHTAWIRFNDAPTVGFEQIAGSKTTLRIQNNLYCGFNEGKEEICSPYTKFSTRAKCHPTQGRPCPIMQFSNPVHVAVRNFMRPRFYQNPLIDVNGFHWNTSGHVDTSAGFFGVLLALHLCGEVRIYGFDQHPNHYYSKKPSATTKPFETRHAWDAERHCLETYEEKLPDFRMEYSESGHAEQTDNNVAQAQTSRE